MMCPDNCRHCNNYECRCDSCCYLVEKNCDWYCDKYEDYCNSIYECDEFAERVEEHTDFLDITKAWVIEDLGIEEYSDEWYELMSI